MIRKILKFHDIDETKKTEILDIIFSMKDYKLLYKFLSADILLRTWNGFSNKFDGEKLTELDKKIVINNLTNRDSPGFQFLGLADKTDYVQRDALYFGTIKIDISPKHLYRKALVDISEITDEEAFLDHNLEYLIDVFYENQKIVVFSGLYEKIVAALIQSDDFNIDWLFMFDDESFLWLIRKNIAINKKMNLPKEWIDRADKLFDDQYLFNEVFCVKGVQFPQENSIIDIEHHLIGSDTPKFDLLSYPFNTGIFVSLDYPSVEFNEGEYVPLLETLTPPSKREIQYITIRVFQQEKQQDLTELLKIIDKLSKYLAHDDNQIVRKGIEDMLSWTGKSDVKSSGVLRSIAQAIEKIDIDETSDDLFLTKYVKVLSNDPDYKIIWNKPEMQIWKRTILTDLKEGINNAQSDKIVIFSGIVEDILSLPIKLLQTNASKEFLDKLYECLFEMIKKSTKNDKIGDFFEALCLIDKIRKPEGIFQFFINGFTVTEPTQKGKRDRNEYDIIELRLNTHKKAELWIYMSSIVKNIESKDQRQLTNLFDKIKDTYPNLIIRTRYIVPRNRRSKDWTPTMQDTGRNLN